MANEPTNFRATLRETNDIEVAWDDTSGGMWQHRLLYRPDGSSDPFIEAETLVAGVEEGEFVGLAPLTAYELAVQAFNGMSESDPVLLTTATTSLVLAGNPVAVGNWMAAETGSQNPDVLRSLITPGHQLWVERYNTDFSGQPTGIRPEGTTIRYNTDVTWVVEDDVTMTGGRRLRGTSGPDQRDRLLSIDKLDNVADARIRFRARAKNITAGPFIIKFRATGPTGTDAGVISGQNEYSVTCVFGLAFNQVRLHKNLVVGTPNNHNHLVVASTEFVTFTGDDNPVVTTNCAFDQLQLDDFYEVDAWIIGPEINYKFWRSVDPEPTTPNTPGWIQYVDEQASAAAVVSGDWNGIAVRSGNNTLSHWDTLQAFKSV